MGIFYTLNVFIMQFYLGMGVGSCNLGCLQLWCTTTSRHVDVCVGLICFALQARRGCSWQTRAMTARTPTLPTSSWHLRFLPSLSLAGCWIKRCVGPLAAALLGLPGLARLCFTFRLTALDSEAGVRHHARHHQRAKLGQQHTPGNPQSGDPGGDAHHMDGCPLLHVLEVRGLSGLTVHILR